MKEPKIKWQSSGAKTTIACFQTGEHFAVRELDKKSGEVQLIGQTFSLTEAWEMYHTTVGARMHKALWEQDKARRPEDGKRALVTQQGVGHVTDLRDPFMEQLMEDYRAGNRIRHGDPLSDDQRREFDRMVVAFLAPDLPKQILNTMK